MVDHRRFGPIAQAELLDRLAPVIARAPAGVAEPTKETRAKMATIHEQMAACLRSDKSMNDCRSEMMTACQTLLGDSGCPMMGWGKRSHMMQGPATAVPKAQ